MFGKSKKNPYPRKKYTKRVVRGLKGGCGEVTVYTAKERHEDPDVYEWGYLIIPPGTSIGSHCHEEDMESWEVQEGMVEYQDTETPPEILEFYSGERICQKGWFHRLMNFGDCTAILMFKKFR